jgi:Holliday junction DNA helicase RuvA
VIGRLRGLVAEVGEEDALIDVAGVGYLARCGARTLSRLPALGDEVTLHIEHHWSEAQGPRLYGFLSKDERRAFVALQAIQGVGPKAALGVLDVLTPADLVQAVAREDKAAVGRAQGVGPKLALRIVTELKDKAGPALGPIAGGVAAPKGSAEADAISALGNLGFRPAEASAAVGKAVEELGEGATLDALVRLALRKASKA